MFSRCCEILCLASNKLSEVVMKKFGLIFFLQKLFNFVTIQKSNNSINK